MLNGLVAFTSNVGFLRDFGWKTKMDAADILSRAHES
jgi:hypothetical protein